MNQLPFARLRAASLLVLGPLAACSGGTSGPAPDPAILEFRAERADYTLGERARLRVRYAGAPGRIEPGAWPVGGNAWFETPPLGLTNTFELVVGDGADEVRQSLRVEAPYRERFTEIPTGFRVANHATVPTDDGGALVIGGDQGLSILGYEIFRFDPASRTFRSFGQLVYGRDQHRAVRLEDGRTLVVGGELSANIVGTPSELVDEDTGAVALSGSLARDRAGHTATLLLDGRVLVLGGNSNDRLESDVRASAEVWDAATGSFRLLPQEMVRPRVGHTATRLPDGRVLIYGGDTRAGSSTLSAEIFDPMTEAFAPLADPETTLRTLHAAIALEDGTVCIAGGEDAQGRPLATALLFDAATFAFRPAPGAALGRSFAAAERLLDGRLLLAGGTADTSGTPTAAAELLSAGTPGRPIEPMRFSRRAHTITRLSNGSILIVGGEGPGGVLRSSAELFD